MSASKGKADGRHVTLFWSMQSSYSAISSINRGCDQSGSAISWKFSFSRSLIG